MSKFSWELVKDYFYRALHSPFGVQAVVLGLFLVFVMGFRPSYSWGTYERFGFDSDIRQSEYLSLSEPGFIRNTAGTKTTGIQHVEITDEDGNIIKVQVRTRDKVVRYIVKSGDNPSKIAHKFGIKVSTLLWANSLTAKQTLSVGEKLRIPPTDGVFYKVHGGDTLSEIAKVHAIDIKKIYAYNKLSDTSVIKKDQEIFLPEAKKVFVQRSTSAPGIVPSFTSGGGEIPSIGVSLRQPTRGIITQGYHRKHYALDIANKLNTPIYAAAAGTVVTSDNGWNYGYGNYIIIDHGNGVETLYAHNNTRKVSVGDYVQAGQLIALMGNSGNVWGPTGIHVHFEVRINGRKVNPGNYF